MSVAEFFHMGGFALFIWSSFAVTLLFIVIEISMLRIQQGSLLKRVRGMRDIQHEPRGQ